MESHQLTIIEHKVVILLTVLHNKCIALPAAAELASEFLCKHTLTFTALNASSCLKVKTNPLCKTEPISHTCVIYSPVIFRGYAFCL